MQILKQEIDWIKEGLDDPSLPFGVDLARSLALGRCKMLSLGISTCHEFVLSLSEDWQLAGSTLGTKTEIFSVFWPFRDFPMTI